MNPIVYALLVHTLLVHITLVSFAFGQPTHAPGEHQPFRHDYQHALCYNTTSRSDDGWHQAEEVNWTNRVQPNGVSKGVLSLQDERLHLNTATSGASIVETQEAVHATTVAALSDLDAGSLTVARSSAKCGPFAELVRHADHNQEPAAMDALALCLTSPLVESASMTGDDAPDPKKAPAYIAEAGKRGYLPAYVAHAALWAKGELTGGKNLNKGRAYLEMVDMPRAKQQEFWTKMGASGDTPEVVQSTQPNAIIPSHSPAPQQSLPSQPQAQAAPQQNTPYPQVAQATPGPMPPPAAPQSASPTPTAAPADDDMPPKNVPMYPLNLPFGSERWVAQQPEPGVDTTPQLKQMIVGTWQSQKKDKIRGLQANIVLVFHPNGTFNEFIDFAGGTAFPVQIWGTYDVKAVRLIAGQVLLRPTGIQPEAQCDIWSGKCQPFKLQPNIISFLFNKPDNRLETPAAVFRRRQ